MKKYTVLYAEDDLILLNNYADFLDLFFQEVFKATSGKEALTIYEKESPDVIITDINMPNMNGLDFVKKVREKNKDVIIIILSAYSDKEKLLSATQLFLTQYLIKPIKSNDLVILIQDITTLLDKRENHQLIQINKNYFWDKRKLKLFDKDGIDIGLQAKEVNLLNLFCTTNLNKVYSTEEILNFIWEDSIVNKSTTGKLRVLFSTLNKKLEHELFESTYKIGYKFKRD
ncbi:hypothetical protein A9Q76_09975 [Arcobacter sp. 31_11_sub10_T18]|nr:hypothetical protein A9Q76_09975 [Arcobacter sp. 31_11_sub10_T18]